MVSLYFVVIFIGLLTLLGVFVWLRQREQMRGELNWSSTLREYSMGNIAQQSSAVLVCSEHGQLLYMNDRAREWVQAHDRRLTLEDVARQAQPFDNFINLLTAEERTSFQLGGHWLEGQSYFVPSDEGRRTVVILNQMTEHHNPGESDTGKLGMSQMMTVIDEISRTVNAGMGVELALQVLLEIVNKAMPSDAGEICLWNEEDNYLVQRGWIGDTRYLLAIATQGGGYESGRGIAGWILQNNQPIRIAGSSDAMSINALMSENPYTSAVGVPLWLGERFIGTLTMFSNHPDNYNSEDVTLLQAINTAVATAIANAELYAQQEDRIRDIASLQEIAEQPKGDTDSRPIYRLLNERMAKLMLSDMCGVFLYDEERRALAPQLPFYGLPDQIAERILIPLPQGSPQRDVWENQPYWVSNDLPDEPLVEGLHLLDIVRAAGLYNTAIFPLQIAGERIGAISVSNRQSEGGFTPNDLQNLRVLSSQAALVVENLRLHQRERRIDTELVGLQEMTYAIGALSHEEDFFYEINERISRLMDSAMCGVMIYDEERHALVAQPPFYGIETDLIAEYAINLPTGSVMEQLWQDEDIWFSNRIATDPLVYEAGLDELAEKAGLYNTLFAVMAAGGRRIGVIQVSNKDDQQKYDDKDARLLQIFATQAGAIIENARLVREVQVRANQAEQLRQIAERASQVITYDESFKPVLESVAYLMQSEFVFINVVDNNTNMLLTYPHWVYGVDLTETITQDMNAEGYQNIAARSGVPFMSNALLTDDRTLTGYKRISKRYGLRSVVMVPLVVGDRILGELGVANKQSGNYGDTDLATLSTVAAQIASAVERLLLFEMTDENLRRRLEELDAISRVSNELTLTVKLDSILSVIAEEAIKATKADNCTIALLRPNDQWRVADQPELARRLEDNLGGFKGLAGAEIEAVMRGAEAFVVNEYTDSDLDPVPKLAASAAVAAILHLDQVVGTIHVYSNMPNTFDDRAARFLMTLASKAALAYQNAELYNQQQERGQRLRQRVDQLQRIFELGQMVQTTAESDVVLEAVAYSVQQSVGFDTVLMTLFDEDDHSLRRVAHAGLPLDAFEKTRDQAMSQEALEHLLVPEYLVAGTTDSFFFPIEKLRDWYLPDVGVLSTAYDDNRSLHWSGKGAWRDGDMLIVRMNGQGGNIIGAISLDRPYNNKRPDRSAVEVLEIFAHQAAAMIENTRLFSMSERNAELEAHLSDVVERMASSFDMTDIARILAEGLRDLVLFHRLTLVTLDDENEVADYIRVLRDGNQLEIKSDVRNTLERTALERVIKDQEELVYDINSEWVRHYEDLRAWYAQGETATLILPLLSGGECIGALHVGSNDGEALFDTDIRQLLRRTARLVASTVQNALLYNQAVTLQSLNRSVVESIQQGIVVLDNSGRILTINDFMRKVYGWEDQARRRDLFDYRPELSEVLSDDLRIVLEEGIPRERIGQTSPDEANEIAVRNFYMYPLRSRDQIRGAVLLVEDVTERARLEEAIEQRANQLAALTEVSTRITASLEREEVIELAMDEMGWIIPFDTMTMWRRNGSFMLLEGVSGVDLDVLENDIRLRIGDNIHIEQLVESQRVVGFSEGTSPKLGLPETDRAKSWMGVPLVNQGHVVGMFVLTTDEVEVFDTRQEQHVAFAFASQVAIALANADLFEQTFERTNELGTLLEASQATSLTRNIDDVFRTVAELMFSALEMEDCAIMIRDDVNNSLDVAYSTNRSGETELNVPVGERYNVGDYPARDQALKKREVVVIIDVEDIDRLPPYPRELEEMREFGRGSRMLVPLVVREQSRGLIQLEQTSNQEEAITQQKVRLARALGAQVAIAIENARLTSETNTRFEELLTINQLSQSISATLKLDDMLPVIRDQVLQVTNAEELYLALYDEKANMVRFPLAVRDGGEQFVIAPRELGNDEVSYVIRRSHPLNLGADYFSIGIDEVRRSMGIVTGEGDAKAYLGVPLRSGDEVLGVLAIRNLTSNQFFTVNEIRILETVGSQLGAAIQNARLFERVQESAEQLEQLVDERTDELEEERDRLDTLYQITSELARTLDMEQLLDRSLGMVAKAVDADDGVILLTDPATDALYGKAWLNPHNVYEKPPRRTMTHPSEGLAEWLIHSDETFDHVVVIDDLNEESYWDERGHKTGLRSALAVMLEHNEDPMGVMVLLSSDPYAFTEGHLKLLVPAANQVAASINSADLYQLIRDQAEKMGKLLRTEQEEAQKHQAILESIADGVMLADSSGTIISFNNAAERILEIPRHEVIGYPVNKLAGLYGESTARWMELIGSVTEADDDERIDALDESITERVTVSDKIISTRLSPVYIGDLFLGMVSVFRDITGDVEADRAKAQFIANVSHEFRTPLTPIKGYTDLLLASAAGQLDPMQAQMLQTIKENTDRLALLVDDVLNISRLDSGDSEVHFRMVDLGDLVKTEFDKIDAEVYNIAKNMTTTITIDDDLPLIRADSDKLQQVFLNIIDNAFNYTRANGTIDVQVRYDAETDVVNVSVQDTGVGIPEDFRDAAWRRFERYDQHAVELDVAGTGLGLSLARDLVYLHNGDIWFDSEVGVGSTFYVRLPVEQPNYKTSTLEIPRVDSETVAGD